MAAKQLAQSLSHKNCQIPYVIGKDYKHLSENSSSGLCFAEDEGQVYFSKDDLIIYHYKNKNDLQVKYIPPIKKTHGIFASSLRHSLKENDIFNFGDIIYEYDCFNNGIPSVGYNAFISLMPAFGMNFEDSIIITESFADRVRANFVEKVYVPIYEYTLLKPMFGENTESFGFFPNIGQKVDSEGVVCCTLTPKTIESLRMGAGSNIKNKMLLMLKSMSLSDLFSMSNSMTTFNIDKIRTKLIDGKISGFKIHKLCESGNMLDKKLQEVLEKLYQVYAENFVESFYDLSKKFSEYKAREIIKRHYVYRDKDLVRNKLDLKNIIYLLEFEVTEEKKTTIGDKIANQYANKGVISAIIPDELSPIALQTNKKIEVMLNPFGIFSRMNLGQLVNGIIGKNVMHCDNYIKTSDCKDIKNIIWWLNEYVIKNFNTPEYFNQVDKNIVQRLDEPDFKNNFINNIKDTNLFIEAPTFGEINVRNILKHGVNPNEDVFLSKKYLKYMKEKLKCDISIILEDVTLKNIFCSPMYITKLCKLANKLITARDLGPCRAVNIIAALYSNVYVKSLLIR
jgi:hypothetical protein